MELFLAIRGVTRKASTGLKSISKSNKPGEYGFLALDNTVERTSLRIFYRTSGLPKCWTDFEKIIDSTNLV